MSNPKKQDFSENESALESENGESSDFTGLQQSSYSVSSSDSICNSSLPERLLDSVEDEITDDPLPVQNTRDDFILHLLQALDLQFTGACRSDERLKPFLKINVSCGIAEDRFLSHLNKNFDASEIGMLARCLCVPLVSVRVGKVTKGHTRLFPTSARGNLNLSLMPSSDLCLSFIGDDGSTERLTTLSTSSQCAAVEIEGIPADSSGLSFFLKLRGDQAFYFWCSERSKLIGDELLSQMRNLLVNKPSLAEITGISDDRLTSFARQIRSCFPPSQCHLRFDSLSHWMSYPLFHLHSAIPRFKEGVVAIRRRSDDSFSPTDLFSPASSSSPVDDDSGETEKLPSGDPLSLPLLFGNQEITVLADTKSGNPSPLPPSILFPQYCWCPSTSSPSPSSSPTRLLMAMAPSDLLSDNSPSAFDFHLPIPACQQQIHSLTPLVCDPIVHIPVIEVCSSGQGYIVSSAPQLIPEADSLVEKEARETLHLLISASPGGTSAPQLLSVLPGVLSRPEDKPSVLVMGSRGFYAGTQDAAAPKKTHLPPMALLSSSSSSSSSQVICLHRASEVDVCDYTDDYNQSTGSGGKEDTI